MVLSELKSGENAQQLEVIADQKQGDESSQQLRRDFFYHKGWRGESQLAFEEDPLQVVLGNCTNGRNIGKAVKRLLESGGDERSVSDPVTGLTKYDTPTEPREGIHRSSCTSNAPSEEAFERGVDTLRQLILEAENVSRQKHRDMVYTSPEDLFRKLLCDIRERLRSVLELSCEDLISLFPSGTDAELMPALLAFTRAAVRIHKRHARGHEVFSIVTAAGEVGSGTTQAAMGQHFAEKLPSGRWANKDELQVFGNRFKSVNLSLRKSNGQLLSVEERDQKVEEMVELAAQERGADGLPRYGCIVVHLVLGSSTGQCMPTIHCLDNLVKRYGRLVLPVVDACQGRLKSGAIRESLDKHHVVLCTGSKFFGGPPFSGVCLLSEQTGHELELLLMGEEAMHMLDRSKLKDYVVSPLLSDDLPNMKGLLPHRPLNYGVLMRWTMALHEMESYFVDVPTDEVYGLMAAWAKGVRTMIEELDTPLITLHDDGSSNVNDEQGIALSTIVCFHCRCHGVGTETAPEKMSMDDLRRVKFLMASNLAKNSPHLNLLGPARTLCFIGQPVDLVPQKDEASVVDTEHVLRIAMSAPVVVRMWTEGVDAVLTEDRIVMEKLLLILRNWFYFKSNI
eukprot:TRINITY_DN61149_c0_g1_i1.p1 TRINITY_DN61149_c0_g1~~TRINITY_DN61149_c0_g1_i1.p1  ORF type:complete len:622 (-),score=103.31 TRINITY_DN61149_c0_g1_i1:246-2111(-)